MLNSVNLHGRLTADPELKYIPSGTAVTSFYIAVDDGKKANFFKCVAWAGTAETICKHFYKGRQIIVDGRLDTYTDKNGIKRTDVFIVIEKLDFCDTKSDEQKQREFEEAINSIEPPPIIE